MRGNPRRGFPLCAGILCCFLKEHRVFNKLGILPFWVWHLLGGRERRFAVSLVSFPALRAYKGKVEAFLKRKQVRPQGVQQKTFPALRNARGRRSPCGHGQKSFAYFFKWPQIRRAINAGDEWTNPTRVPRQKRGARRKSSLLLSFKKEGRKEKGQPILAVLFLLYPWV